MKTMFRRILDRAIDEAPGISLIVMLAICVGTLALVVRDPYKILAGLPLAIQLIAIYLVPARRAKDRQENLPSDSSVPLP